MSGYFFLPGSQTLFGNQEGCYNSVRAGYLGITLLFSIIRDIQSK
jgi:hypothetical protein